MIRIATTYGAVVYAAEGTKEDVLRDAIDRNLLTVGKEYYIAADSNAMHLTVVKILPPPPASQRYKVIRGYPV